MEKLIRAMIARGEVLEAVNTLIELLPEGELSNEMVLHSSRLVSTRRNLRMNLISREEAERTKAQVTGSLALERHELAHHLLHAGGVLDLLDGVGLDHGFGERGREFTPMQARGRRC